MTAFNLDTHRIIIAICFIGTFIIGIYIGRGAPYIGINHNHDKDHLTFIASINKSSVNVSDELSFFNIGTKYQTDKVTLHQYETMYEKNLHKYIGSNISLLEIGLGCGMGYGPGASAYLWRDYLGPRVNIHFIEYDRVCGEEWYKIHGEKVIDYRNLQTKYISQK